MRFVGHLAFIYTYIYIPVLRSRLFSVTHINYLHMKMLLSISL